MNPTINWRPAASRVQRLVRHFVAGIGLSWRLDVIATGDRIQEAIAVISTGSIGKQ